MDENSERLIFSHHINALEKAADKKSAAFLFFKQAICHYLSD